MHKNKPVSNSTHEIITDKKNANFNWREVTESMISYQSTINNGRADQDIANINIKSDKPIVVLTLADLHLGSYGTDYKLFKDITDELLGIENLYVVLLGDLLQMSIKMRGIAEISDNLLPPSFQMDFLSSWFDEIKHKVLFSTWDNHSVEREESAVGFSSYAKIFSKNTIYFNGIGHTNLQIGNEVYNICASHTFKGNSALLPCSGQMNYMRKFGLDREIAIAGDSHVPGLYKYADGGKLRMSLNTGTLQTDSSYAKRYFTLTTNPTMPCFTLDPDEHIFTPYWSLKEYLKK